MSKTSLGLSKRIAAGLLASGLALFGTALAPSAGADTIDTVTDACGRLAGQTRFGTAGAIADAYEAEVGGVDTAIIANGRNFPDALAASGLARDLNAPILLVEPPTGTDSVPLETQSALDELGVQNLVIVGGTAAVSEKVEDDLDARYGTVTRVAGDVREDTAAEIAREIGTAGEYDGLTTAIVATGDNYPDALAGGPISYHGDGTDPFPILLTRGGDVPASTEAALEELGIEQVIVLGGTAAVPASAVAELAAITGNDPIVLAGAQREDTARAVAEFAVDELGFELDAALLADGRRHFPSPDALSGGPLGGVTDSPILLVTPETLPPATEDFLTEHADELQQVIALGGTAAVSPEVLDQACEAAGVPLEGPVGPDARLDQEEAEAGDTITGTLEGDFATAEITGECVEGAPVEVTPEDDTDPDADEVQFEFTIAQDAEAGDCEITITFFDEDGNEIGEETFTITIGEAGTVTSRPELVSAQIVGTNTAQQAGADGTTVRFCFDEEVTGAAPTGGLFRVYDADADPFAGTTATVEANGRCVVVLFPDIDTTAEAADLTVAGVNEDAVVDDEGQSNAIGDAPLGTDRQTTVGQAGVTAAPDLQSVAAGASNQGALGDQTIVTFTFDEPALVVNDAGFHLILTSGEPVDCVATDPDAGGPLVEGGQNATTPDNTIVVECQQTAATGPITSDEIARGIVDEFAVEDPDNNDNPLQASNTPDQPTPEPDLVSARFDASDTTRDLVIYTFDEPVLVTGAGDFCVYNVAGDETCVTGADAVRSTTNSREVVVTFAEGDVADAVGANVRDGVVEGATGTAGRANEEDEVGVQNEQTSTIRAGRTSGPDLIDVDLVETANGPVLVFTFDENIVEGSAALTDGDFLGYDANGVRYECTTATSNVAAAGPPATGTGATTDDNTVTCTAFARPATLGGAASANEIRSIVLGAVEELAVTDAQGDQNPKGAEITANDPAAA